MCLRSKYIRLEFCLQRRQLSLWRSYSAPLNIYETNVSKTLGRILLAASLLIPVGGAAQNPGPDDPTVLAPETGTVPGRITRPTREEPEDEPEEDPGTEEAEAPSEGTGDAAPSGTANNAVGDRPDEPEERRGPRILDVEEIEPDIGEIPSNFEEEFDPFDLPTDVRVNIDFREAELQDVVMWISALTGRNFIIADTINASKKITIISPQPVSIAEAYRAFIAALNMNGLTVVPFGRFLKIVEASGAERQVLTPTESYSQIPNDDRMVTHIHRLQHVALSSVQGVIDALKTEAASIVSYEPTNTMIITETGTNLRRLLDVLQNLDVPGGEEQINIYQVRYAAASDLSSLLLEIFDQEEEAAPVQEAPRRRSRRRSDDDEAAQENTNGANIASPSSVNLSQIIADERTNQLIIIANDRSYEQILGIIAHLDVPIPGEGQIHVLFLENADATELASTLQSLTQSVEDMREETRPSVADDDGRAGGSPVSATFSGELSITADEATNSLVVVASLRDFLALQNVVSQLDRRRQQVYVEAVVMEISLDRQRAVGLAFHGGVPGVTVAGEETPIIAASSVGGLNSLTPDLSNITGLTALFQGPSLDNEFLELLGLSSVGAILQATQTDNDVNILSTPHILTMDNEEAEIIVGENIPFISGVGGGLGGALGGSSGIGGLLEGAGLDSSLGSLAGSLGGFGGGVSVQRQDVALTLRITPQINESNFVRLEIEEEVEDVQSIDPVLGPRTTTRQARTTVVVQDQQTIVIGGLMRDTTTEDVGKVPFLGDIPLIGRLFRHTSTRSVKTNLLLLLTPYIIRDTEDFQAIFRRKMEEREEFLAFFGRRDSEFMAAVDYARKDGPMQSVFETINDAVELEEARRRAFSDTTQEVMVPAPTNAPMRPTFDDEPSEPQGLLNSTDATAQ